tara:strand:+ start:219 stop:926 length:708 start_codon:yes stop_codon:yes gene_type:complete
MEKKLIGYLFLLSFVFVNTADAQFKDLKKLNPLGGGDKQESQESAVDIDTAQANLIAAVSDALVDVLTAQAMIAEAQGNGELAATLKNTSSAITGGDGSSEDIQGAVTLSEEAREVMDSVVEEKGELDDDAKALYAKALVPYVKAVAKTAKLSEPISDFMNSAQNSLKSIRNPMEIRKLKSTLDTGLFVGKNVPKLIVSLGKSSVGLITFAKKNGLDTSEVKAAREMGDGDDLEM